jgi:hypothetical protein
MGRIGRGWALAKKSFAILHDHRTLVAFPIISALATIVAAGALAGPGIGLYYATDRRELWLVVFGIPAYYAVTFVAIFFNVALAGAAARALKGEETSVGEGLAVARGRVGAIAGWAAVQAVIGLAIHALEQAFNESAIGQIVGSVLGFTWSVMTFFVVPVLALEGPGPIQALKRSARILRERWGEGLVGAAAISFVIVLLPALVVVGLVAFGIALLGDNEAAAVTLFVIAGVIVIVVGVVSSTLSQIFRVAVYEYAVADRPIGGFTADELESAFRPRRARLGGI